MKAGQLRDYLFEKYPRENACSWDNVGLLCGDPEQEIERLLVALDVTDDVIDEAIAMGADGILAHHPLLRGGLMALTPEKDGRAYRLCRAGIAAVCMHTNLDISEGGVGDCLADALRLNAPRPVFADEENAELLFGRVGRVREQTPEGFCEFVKDALKTPFVRAVLGTKPVRTVAVMGGSGKDYIEQAASVADAYVTADCRYHDFQLAERLGLTLIDAGHYPTENVVIPALCEAVREAFEDVEIRVSEHADLIRLI